MNKILWIAGLSELINDWNEKLNSFASQYMDNVWFGGAMVLILFVFGCWAISYFAKK